jgi:hypothetical protein
MPSPRAPAPRRSMPMAVVVILTLLCGSLADQFGRVEQPA